VIPCGAQPIKSAPVMRTLPVPNRRMRNAEGEKRNTMAKRIAVKDLRAGSIEATPINVEDWQKVFGEDSYDGDGNQFWEASRCDTCNRVEVLHMGGGNCQHRDHDSDAKCQGYLDTSEGPMMNYWYKVDLHTVSNDPDEAARLIADLPLCVVQIDGEYGLALTGGGMDLSWEICEAYTRLGQLPPSHFCGLPRMAGRGESARDRYILSACRASLNVQMGWLKGRLRDLRSFGAMKAEVR
jgi:hypothetical protein